MIQACIFLFTVTLWAQNCIPTNINGSTINLACNQVCSNLNFQIPHIKGTADYTVRTVPYTPYPYITATGVEDLILYNDDRYSNLINLPFTFCFYGATYNTVVVGSNGIITFDPVNSSPGCANGYVIDQGIPYNGGIPCAAATTYYPRASIMGAYSDLDPRTPIASPADRKIQWEVFGTAPCRKFVVSYYHIGAFGSTCGLVTPNTFQIVIHESTGVVEVFTERKTCNSTTNAGRAILGIQNWNQDAAVPALGKNNRAWSETNTGYQFTPSGGGSRYVSSRLFTMTGTLVAAADTTTTLAGLLDLSFPNVCPPTGSTQYRVVTTFSACDNAATTLITEDTITINRTNGLNATATTTNTGCGIPSGSITATVPAGIGNPPYTYILDGGSPVVIPALTHTFTNVAAGPHTVIVTDGSGGCTSTINATIARTNNLAATTTVTATGCPGVNNGTITVTPVNGTGPYTFSIDGGAAIAGAAPFTFTNIATGPHTIVVNDAGSTCVSNPVMADVPAGAALAVAASAINTSCSGASNGTITISSVNGSGPYTFSLDGGAAQPGTIPFTFTNVAAGLHNVIVTDGLGCGSGPVPVAVTAGPPLATAVNKTDALCNGSATGTITVTQPLAGTAPYQYSLDGINWQAGNIFTGLIAGNYTAYYRESNGCQGSQPITVLQPVVLSAAVTAKAVMCNGQNNGTITAGTTGGVAPYQYSINGGTTWQAGAVFTVAAGAYTVTVRDANNCIISQNINVTEPPVLTATAAATNASCDGGNDGTIVVAAAGGNSNYQYSIDGVTFQAGNTFNVAPGNYFVTVKDNLNCTATFAATVGLTNNLTLTPQTDQVICEGTSRQLRANSNGTVYAWTPATGLSSASISNPVANPTATTQYIVTSTLGRCSVSDTIIINVNAAPVPNAGPDGFICFGQTYQLVSSGGIAFNWTPSTYLNSPIIANPVAEPSKTTVYTLSVIDANGCNSLVTDNVTVDVTPPIKVSMFPYDTVGYPGDQFQLRSVSVANMYNWSPATGLNNPNIPDPVVTVGAIGDDVIYKVTASTIAGCKGEGFVRVRIYKGPDIYVPTGFTPNGDGKNDKFIPFPVGIRQINYFRVFNRWGANDIFHNTAERWMGWQIRRR